MKYSRYLLLLTIGIVMGAVVTFAQDDDNDDMAMPDPALVERGYEVFVANNCTACHGQNAQGTDIAPALAGHSEFAVRRQIRAPVGIMIVFGPDVIPEEDLEALVAYITTLEPGEDMAMGGDHAHEHGGVAPGDILFAHHWMLWLALEADNLDEALHQTAHIIERVEGIHLVRMQEIFTALSEGDMDIARTIVEPMVTDVGEFSDDVNTIILQMIYLAVTTGDAESALHFANHYVDHATSDEEKTMSATLTEEVEMCHFDEAAQLIVDYLGDDVHFVPDTMGEMDMGNEDADHDMNMDDDHSDDGDEHDDMNMDSDHNDDDMDMDNETESNSMCSDTDEG